MIEKLQAENAASRAEIAERRAQREAAGDCDDVIVKSTPELLYHRTDNALVNRAHERDIEPTVPDEEMSRFEALADVLGEHTGALERELRKVLEAQAERISTLETQVQILRGITSGEIADIKGKANVA